MAKANIGTIVLYRTDGRGGLAYDLPAMINCTPDTHPGDYPKSKERPKGGKNPLKKPEGNEVHLTVFSPGGFGTQVWGGDPATVVPAPEPDDFVDAEMLAPGSGTYVELNVPYWEPVGTEVAKIQSGDTSMVPARTWRRI